MGTVKMGGRLSVPQSTDGLSEISRPTAPGRYRINGRTIVAPAAAFTMACLLFFYSRTSIQAARLNAQKHREADGGQISWRNESLRRHGHADRIEGTGGGKLIREAFRERPVTSKDIAREKLEKGEGPSVVTGLSDSEQARALERYKEKQKRRYGSGDEE